jgi:hypothetical protein
MKTTKHIWIGIIVVIVIAVGALYAHGVRMENAERTALLADLGSASKDLSRLEAINGFQIENLGKGSFNINGNDANPSRNEYYTTRPVQLAEFASSTDLSPEQLKLLVGFLERYPYIESVAQDLNISRNCSEGNVLLASCRVIKVYLKTSLFSQWFSAESWHSQGYMYIPFQLNESDQAYLERYFGGVTEIAPDWYAFSGGAHF